MLRNGIIPDKELFRAVLNGKEIELEGTVKNEQDEREKKFKEM